ncbi:DUF2505 domain-containing protein [Mycolicibacterium hippocampi]|uniref:DUF2505 domain-containing protein n=1 Tax=Mycolicibacterium hippocampi TaxID=659824 RepID=UPI003511E419
MPRPFDVDTDSPATVEEICSAFANKAYWRARIAEFGGGATTLDTLSVESDGTISVATTQDLRHDVLPGVLAKVFTGGLEVVRTETWRPAGDDRVTGEVTLAASGVPGSGVGSALIAPRPAGSGMSLSGTVEVKIPLVGGRIEKYICDQIAVEIPALQRFTSDWISTNA